MASITSRFSSSIFKSIQDIPKIGFGAGTAWYVGFDGNLNETVNEDLVSQILTALRKGFRHLDLAEMYGNDASVGAALDRWFEERAASGESREQTRSQIWITSKLSYSICSDVVQGCRDVIGRLRCDYLDLYLVHAPLEILAARAKPKVSKYSSDSEVWQEVEKLVDLHLVRFAGISNWRGSDIQRVFDSESIRVKPVMHQVEFHALLQQPRLQSMSERYGMMMASYGGLAPLLDATASNVKAVLQELAAQHNVDASVILQKWIMKKGVVVITTSRSPERIAQFLTVESLALSDEDFEKINQAARLDPIVRKFWGSEYKVDDVADL